MLPRFCDIFMNALLWVPSEDLWMLADGFKTAADPHLMVRDNTN